MIRATVPAPGMLVIWHDVADGQHTAVSEWYNAEHHFERIEVPGFLEVHRYVAADSESRHFFCLYRTTDAAVLFSPAYLERVNNPSLWTRQVMPLYRNLSRTICELTYAEGRADGGNVAVWALALDPDGLSQAQLQPIFATLMQEPGVLRCRWLSAANSVSEFSSSGLLSTEAHLRNGPEQHIDAAIIIDTNELSQAESALRRLDAMLSDLDLAYTTLLRGIYYQVFHAKATTA